MKQFVAVQPEPYARLILVNVSQIERIEEGPFENGSCRTLLYMTNGDVLKTTENIYDLARELNE